MMTRLLRGRSLRTRITLTFVATAVLLAVGLSAATFLAVRDILEDQRVASATRQTVFGMLFAREFLRTDPDDLEELVSLLQTREEFQAMVTDDTDWFSTSLAISPEIVPASLQQLVRGEQLAWQRTTLERRNVLVFGGPLPPERTDLYLFFPLEDIDETLGVLLRSLAVISFAVAVIGAVSAQRVAGRVLRPLADVSGAAQRVAEGLLETRVNPGAADEVGRMAASFNRMAEAFQEMIDRERRFVANVSHELRTPLSTLRTASDVLIAHRDEIPASAREAAELLSEDVSNMERLIAELMEVSEVDAGRAVVRLEEVDVRAMVDATVARYRRDARVSGAPAVTATDKARLERVLANLIDNAYEHGEGRDVRIEVSTGDGSCAVAVSDHGPGIAAADLPHLFDRFYKADRARTRDRGGIGLGLAIAFENARLLDGSLDARSDAGVTTFTLTLPMREARDA